MGKCKVKGSERRLWLQHQQKEEEKTQHTGGAKDSTFL
jgi:hypothetical protein